jgi:hypothetical protein
MDLREFSELLLRDPNFKTHLTQASSELDHDVIAIGGQGGRSLQEIAPISLEGDLEGEYDRTTAFTAQCGKWFTPFFEESVMNGGDAHGRTEGKKTPVKKSSRKTQGSAKKKNPVPSATAAEKSR